MASCGTALLSFSKYLVWGEVVEQLADVVAVLALPVVACPCYTVSPVTGAVCDESLMNSVQHLCRLSSRKLKSTLHKLWVATRTRTNNFQMGDMLP